MRIGFSVEGLGLAASTHTRLSSRMHLGLGVWGLGFGVWGLGLGFRGWGLVVGFGVRGRPRPGTPGSKGLYYDGQMIVK